MNRTILIISIAALPLVSRAENVFLSDGNGGCGSENSNGSEGRSPNAVTVPRLTVAAPTEVAFDGFERPVVGGTLSVDITAGDPSRCTYRWTKAATNGAPAVVIGTDPTYAPTADDLEHFIQVVVDEDGIAISSNRIYLSRLPVVYLDTDDGLPVTVKEEYKSAKLVIQGNESFDLQYAGTTQVKGRGNSSWYYPQKPLKLKLDKKADLFGFGSNKHWVLLSNYIDVSSLRNEAGSALAKTLGIVGMDMTAVALVYNGDYHGVYELCEHIRVDKNRIDIFNWDDEAERVADGLYKAIKDSEGLTSDDKDALESQMDEDLSWLTTGSVWFKGKNYALSDYGLWQDYDFSGGYLFEMDTHLDAASQLLTRRGLCVMVDSPECLSTDPTMCNVVSSLWDRFEAAYCSAVGYNQSGEHFSDIADLDSMAAFWLVNEVLANYDSHWNSRYASIDLRGKLRFGPVWDFDSADVCRHGGSIALSNSWTTTGMVVDASQGVTGQNFFRDWVKYPVFQAAARELYWEKVRPWLAELVREGGWIDVRSEFRREAGQAQDRRWRDVGMDSWPEIDNRTVAEDVAIYKRFLSNRLAWLDEQFATLDYLAASLKSVSNAPVYDWSTDVGQARKKTVDEIVPLSVSDGAAFVARTYDGYLYSETDGTVVGTLTVKAAAGKTNRKTGKVTSALTGHVQLVDSLKKVSISGVYDLSAGGEQTFTTRSGQSIALFLGTNGLTGRYGEYMIAGFPNVFAAKDAESKATASAANAAYVGTYNLIADEGMFTVTVAKKGKVSVSGTMANGGKASVSTALLVESAGARAVIVAPKQHLAFTVWLDLQGVDGASVSTGTGDVACSVEGLTGAVIGKPGALASGAAFRFDTEGLAMLIGDDTYATYFPNAFPITVSGTKWTFPKAGKVSLNKEKTAVDEAKLGDNPSGLKLTYTAKTGSFKGSFKAYVNKNGRPKAVSVSASGLLVKGVGYGKVTVRNAGWMHIEIR